VAETQSSEGFPTLTKKELSDTIGVSLRQIDSLVAEGLPRVKRGRRYEYPYVAIAWYFQRKLARVEGQRPPALEEAKARAALAQAELAEIELAQRRKQLVAIEDIERQLSRLLDRLRAPLLNLAGQYTPLIIGLRTYGEGKMRLEQISQEIMLELTRAAEDLEYSANGNGTDQKPKKKKTRKRRSGSSDSSKRKKRAKAPARRPRKRKARSAS